MWRTPWQAVLRQAGMLVMACEFVTLATATVPGGFPQSQPAAKYAAFSVLDTEQAVGLGARLGRGTKSPHNPLFVQTELWEQRIDNGYANVIVDLQNNNTPYRLWYDAFTQCEDTSRDDQNRFLKCGGGRREHSALYAESADGLTWKKPALGFAEWDTSSANRGLCCDADFCKCKPGEPGNVPTNVYAVIADGNGVYLDPRETNESLRYKVVGAFLPSNFGGSPGPGKGGGICASADGLHMHLEDCQYLNFTDIHWDTWSNIFWDNRSERYIGTMRATNPNPCGDTFYPRCMKSGKAGCTPDVCFSNARTMSRYESVGSNWRSLGQLSGNQPTQSGTANEQLYVAVTFPYYNTYLQVLMVYNAATDRQEVHCELAWSNDTKVWHRIEPGKDLIPLGAEGTFESHICYGSIPLVDQASGTIREYYFGGDGPHFGVRNSSLALIEFRPQGLAGIGATDGWVMPVQGQTIPIAVTGGHLMITADTDTITGENEQGQDLAKPAGSVKIAVAQRYKGQQNAIVCNTVTGTNVTDYVLQGCDFSSFVGDRVQLTIEISGGALLYTLEFS